jgi:hypothetical protein
VPSLYEDEHGVIRALVDRLGHDLEPSILIGGWATFVRVGGEISLDLISYPTLVIRRPRPKNPVFGREYGTR